ncbi:MAG: hypothetical protein M3Z33_05290 [Actinomycetota bacterium]|nr:hypothetical protein [Actinomycetota bacterium]
MLLLRAVSRLITFLLLTALALVGLVVAVFCIEGGGKGLSLPALARLAHLAQLRREVGRFLEVLESSGPVAKLSALGGLGAVALGLLVLLGVLRSRRDRLALLETGEQGTLAARRRPLAQVASALVEQVRGMTETRARVRPRRRGRGGRLLVRLDGPRGAASDDTAKARAASALAPLTEPFGLRARVRVRHGRDEPQGQ